MATKKTEKTAKPTSASRPAKAAKPLTKGGKAGQSAPVDKKVRAPKAPQAPRHPRGRLVAAHGTKAGLAKTLASALAHGDQDAAALETRLSKASNQQLLRLQKVSAAVTSKWGSRDKLIAAIGTATKKSKDKDYLAKLEKFSLPQLVDLATSHERAAKAAAR